MKKEVGSIGGSDTGDNQEEPSCWPCLLIPAEPRFGREEGVVQERVHPVFPCNHSVTPLLFPRRLSRVHCRRRPKPRIRHWLPARPWKAARKLLGCSIDFHGHWDRDLPRGRRWARCGSGGHEDRRRQRTLQADKEIAERGYDHTDLHVDHHNSQDTIKSGVQQEF